MGLPSFSIRRPVLTAMVFLGLIIMGLISLSRLPVELYQGQNTGIISIIIRARGGLPPLEVEKRITRLVEEVTATVSHLKNLYSNSREAESRVTMEFEPGTNMKFAALEVREKFARVRPLLPREIEKPVIANYDDAQAAVFVFALTSESLSPEEVRDLVETELKPVLARVDGVASVEVYGGRERKILVELDRDKMVAYNIPIGKVMDILGQSNINLLAGSFDRGKFEIAVRSMGAFESVEEVGELGVHATRQGSIIPLKEIAVIKDSYLEPADYARLNLEQNVTVYIKKTSLSNTIPVIKMTRQVLDDFEKEYKDALDIIVVSDKAEMISRAIHDVRTALFIGMFLAIAIIYLFLRQMVLALIVLISIPASVVCTFFFMKFMGISINVMTLSGLALAVGILVDSTVVILENVFTKKEHGANDIIAIRQGAEEVWLPLLASLITTLIVFLPVVFIDKKIQIVYAGFAFTVCASLIASFFVAQMLVPMLLTSWAQGKIEIKPTSLGDWWRSRLIWLRDYFPGKHRRLFRIAAGAFIFILLISFWQGVLMKGVFWGSILTFIAFGIVFSVFGFLLVPGVYRYVIAWTLSRSLLQRSIAMGLIAMITLGSIGMLKKRDMDWPTTLQENEFAIVVFPLAGAKLDTNDDAVKRLENILSKISDVEMFSSTVRKDDVKIFVRLKPSKERQFSKDEIMQIVDEKGNEAIKEIHDDYSLIVDEGASSSEQKKLIVNIFGHENDVLEKLALEFANRMSKVPGLINLVMTDLRKRPEYSLVVDKGRAALYGLTVSDVADSMHAQVRGMRPTKFHELSKGEEIETITRLQAIYRQKIEDLKLIHIATKSGTQIPLGEIANFYPSVGPQTIDRKDKYRYVFVKGDTKRPLEAIAREVKESLTGVEMPDDYYWRFGGAYEELMKGKSELTLALILTIFLVYMVLACLFQSYIQPLLVMISVPMAGVGIWVALVITKTPLSQQVFIGMILLAGYVVNAAIILVDRMNHLKTEGATEREILVHAGCDRLRPILMTTFSTVFGFLPMALKWGQSSDLWSPLAITVIGGLLSSTFLTLFILPHFILISEELTGRAKDFAKNRGWVLRVRESIGVDRKNLST
ncbi:MAG: efflux RND transporter permease subunit [Candidatus Omnitrophica bacterium]|nr:efflux RND transporter permease subunit [Candidatus Omnitrophota bacterium]